MLGKHEGYFSYTGSGYHFGKNLLIPTKSVHFLFNSGVYHGWWQLTITIVAPITMFVQHNFLRIARKRTHLTQLDVASILEISDFANVSRWEQGQKTPNVGILLGYHFLFDVPIESLFERQKHEIRKGLIPRLHDRIEHFKALNPDPKVLNRINYLESVLNRLTTEGYGN